MVSKIHWSSLWFLSDNHYTHHIMKTLNITCQNLCRVSKKPRSAHLNSFVLNNYFFTRMYDSTKLHACVQKILSTYKFARIPKLHVLSLSDINIYCSSCDVDVHYLLVTEISWCVSGTLRTKLTYSDGVIYVHTSETL